MKKTLLLLCFCSLFLFGCPPPKELTAFQKIDYKAITRGSSFQITLEKGSLRYLKNNIETLKKSLSMKNYKSIYKLLKNIDLATIDKIEPPSKRHQFDGALLGVLEIQSQRKIYTSVSFDDDNPPKELKALIDYLKSLTQ
ncbi:MAG: hypothetical protein JKY02_02430 [Flavobacteriaceae bacterium]|nr:hypothetical protein [Flavobacteriaceae bacterium]